MNDREANLAGHPPYCTCRKCVNRRLEKLGKEVHPSFVSTCPLCHKKSLWHNTLGGIYECLNLNCKAIGRSPDEIIKLNPKRTNQTTIYPRKYSNLVAQPVLEEKNDYTLSPRRTPGFVIFLLVVFIIGLASLGIWYFLPNKANQPLTEKVEETLPEEPQTSPQGFEIYSRTRPPYSNSQREQIKLMNNPEAKNPTWNELKNFLLQDPGDYKTYSELNWRCADYAEGLHNRAEAAGIKAAFVAIETESDLPHALNAFQTTDKGAVFIDITYGGDSYINSEGRFLIKLPSTYPSNSILLGNPLDNYDKVAYLELGKTYRLVSLKATDNPTLSGYEEWLKLKKDLLNQTDQWSRGSTFTTRARLEELSKKVGGFWDGLSKVTKVEIYW